MISPETVETLLHCEDDFYLIKKSIEELYGEWSAETDIFAGDLTYEKMKSTDNGFIVTPVHAAHCVKDLMRTTKFLRGIHRAIEHYLEKHSQIRILYAGCGPYATLLTPFTSLYSPEQIRFTLLDIEEVSLDAVQKLYQSFELDVFTDEIRLEDATNPDIEFKQPFHIIISETMQVALRKECQVPITRNLVRFLTPDGTFIPECISLDVYLTDTYNPENPGKQKKEFLGNAYKLDFRQVFSPGYKTEIKIKPSDLNFLQLFTEIYLFGEVHLTARESGLTLPLILDRFSRRKPQNIHFTYHEGAYPELTFEYMM